MEKIAIVQICPFLNALHSKAMAGLKEWEEFLIAIIAGCAIALGVVFMSRKKEAL